MTSSQRMKWIGEQVNVYTNKIRQLVGLDKLAEWIKRTVKLAFVTGFPDCNFSKAAAIT